MSYLFQMDCAIALRDHLTGARAILRARGMVSRPYERCLEHVNVALHHVYELQVTVRRTSEEITTLRRKLAATESSLAFLRRRRQRAPPATQVSNFSHTHDIRVIYVLILKNVQFRNRQKSLFSTACKKRFYVFIPVMFLRFLTFFLFLSTFFIF